MIIDCISDIHGHYPNLDGGDLLIVAGDLTARDTFVEHCDFKLWLYKQNYRKKIVIAGNHDNHFVGLLPDPYIFSSYNSDTGEQRSYADYLCDSGTEFCDTNFEGKPCTMKIYGSPWTKTFLGMNPHCKAFTVDTEEELAEKWALIPDDIDILITHSPPYGILDKVENFDMIGLSHPSSKLYRHCGSKSLHKKLMALPKIKLAVFGHIHESYGEGELMTECKDGWNKCIVVNASHVNERYQPVNKPIRVIL